MNAWTTVYSILNICKIQMLECNSIGATYSKLNMVNNHGFFEATTYYLNNIWCSNILFMIVFISQGCFNKVSQIWWLKTTEIYYFTFLKVQNTKPSRKMFPWSLYGDPSLPLSSFMGWLPSIGVFLEYYLEAESIQFLPLSSHGILLCVSISTWLTSYKNTNYTGWEPTLL